MIFKFSENWGASPDFFVRTHSMKRIFSVLVLAVVFASVTLSPRYLQLPGLSLFKGEEESGCSTRQFLAQFESEFAHSPHVAPAFSLLPWALR
jgi:hypothetical protein